MTESATAKGSRPPGQRAREITRTAQRLVAERGYSSVTLDDIAEAVGVSRRTLFNHVDSKESAVLGPAPTLGPELLARLRGEDDHATSDLLGEALHIAVALLVEAGVEATEDWQSLRDVLMADPQLLPRVQERVETLGREVVSGLAARPGVTDEQARVTFTAVAGVLQTSFEDTVQRPDLGTFAERVDANLALLREIAALR